MGWLSLYRADCRRAQKKEYIRSIHSFAEFFQKDYIVDIKPCDVQSLCNTMSVYSRSYSNKLIHTLKHIFSAAVADGIIARSPADNIRKPKAKKCEGHRALTDEERRLIRSTYKDHGFGLAAMIMMYAGLRRGEVLYLDIDRDVDFINKTITVRGGITFKEGNQATVTTGKTEAALRTIPLVKPLELALAGHHGLVCTKEDGGLMSESAFSRKYESYLTFLETRLNGCHKRWYGKTKEHKALLAQGKPFPPWREVKIRCHDFRVDFCTRNYQAGIPLKTLQAWMGHADVTMILNVYAKLTQEQEQRDAIKLCSFMDKDLEESA